MRNLTLFSLVIAIFSSSFSMAGSASVDMATGKVFCDFYKDPKTGDTQVRECSEQELIQIYKRVQAAHVKDESMLKKGRDASLVVVKVGGTWFLASAALGGANLLFKEDALFQLLERNLIGRGILTLASGGITVAPVLFFGGSIVLGVFSYIGDAHAATVDEFLANPKQLATLVSQDEKTFLYYAKQNPQIIANVIVVDKALTAIQSATRK